MFDTASEFPRGDLFEVVLVSRYAVRDAKMDCLQIDRGDNLYPEILPLDKHDTQDAPKSHQVSQLPTVLMGDVVDIFAKLVGKTGDFGHDVE